MNTLRLTLLVALFATPLTEYAQATVVLDQINDPIGEFTNSSDVASQFYNGQTFTIGKTGFLADIKVDIGKENNPPDAIFFLAPIENGNALISQSFQVAASASTMSDIYYGDGPDFSDWTDLDFSPYGIAVKPGDQFALLGHAPIVVDLSSSGNRIIWFGTGVNDTYVGGSRGTLDVLADGPLRLGLSSDAGFAVYVDAVPEPSTWALFIFGFGATGLVLRRSRRSLSFV